VCEREREREREREMQYINYSREISHENSVGKFDNFHL
jgi:hypothetical protein